MLWHSGKELEMLIYENFYQTQAELAESFRVRVIGNDLKAMQFTK